jgi:SpoVK/Ycf46/Vps4 family AAA+-type ATPase
VNDFELWQDANEAYLATRLEWLRERFAQRLSAADDGESLEQRADQADHDQTNAPTKRGRKRGTRPKITPALEILAERLGLSSFERDVALLCAAMEFDTHMPRLCAKANGDLHRPYPTFALAMTLFDEPAWDAMSPQRPLRRLKLVEMNQPGATPLTAAALRADERIVNFIKGLNYLDDRLSPLLTPLEQGGDVPLPASQQSVVDAIVQQLQQRDGAKPLPIIELVGPNGACKQIVARRVAAAFGLQVQRLPAELIPADFGEFDTLLRLWDREKRLLPLTIYIDAAEADGVGGSAVCSPLGRFLTRVEGLAFLDLPESRPISARSVVTFDVAKPTPLEQRALWTELTGDADAAARLSEQFSFNVEQIHRLAAAAPGDSGALWAACCKDSRPHLDSLAQRIDAKATWDDLVLPQEQLEQLREITGQVRHRSRVYDDWGFRAKHNRGLGISALFAGESGTGKTMAAEVIANDLALDLYRIDLSAVVNKYIGETEKNLRRVFDAADDGGAILLFDEADALFGKRTEVRDSHDRYANLEVNYLLQRMESYRGLAILATNLKDSLDKAFMRRLRFVVDFPMPGAAQRRELWRKAFPAETPLASLDVDRLSNLGVTGGNIHTIALNGAFASAGNGQQVTMPHVLSATRGEFRKLQKPLSAANIRELAVEGNLR